MERVEIKWRREDKTWERKTGRTYREKQCEEIKIPGRDIGKRKKRGREMSSLEIKGKVKTDQRGREKENKFRRHLRWQTVR